MEMDEERTHVALHTSYAVMANLVAKHHGRIFAMAGDSFLAEFASPVEAVKTAHAFQTDLRDRPLDLPEGLTMQFRVGINLGDVIVDGDNLFGDGVNVAVRLEGLAEAGGLCLSSSVYDQVEGKLPLDYEDIGPQALKNIARPVKAYRVSLRRDAETTLSITATSTFSANWLAPRLGAFIATHPDINIELKGMSRVVDFNHEPFDVGIREGFGNWPGLKAHPLMDREFSPFCSPDFLKAAGEISKPSDLLKHQLLDWRDEWWREWFAAAGVENPQSTCSHYFQFDTQLAISQATMSGQGIALLTPEFFKRDVESGRLLRLFDLTGRRGKFWLVYSEARQHSRKIIAFRDWLLREVQPGVGDPFALNRGTS